ncbi:hypothetical protein M2101_001504 [Parabacteroides sp. PM5-20]|nr:hypothetical protein [Parabacteroides sp. PM5-20]
MYRNNQYKCNIDALFFFAYNEKKRIFIPKTLNL